jgi:hypothetical protein
MNRALPLGDCGNRNPDPAGYPDLQGLLRGLVDWSWELRRLLAAQNEKSRRGETPAANGTELGEGQAFTE